MPNPITQLKRGIKRLLGKGPVRAIAGARRPEEETKRQKRLRAKYPQMYKEPKVAGNVKFKRQAGDTSLSRFITGKLKKKYGGK